MAEDIYEPSVTHLQGKTVLHNIHHVEPIIVKKLPKGFFDRYKVVPPSIMLLSIMRGSIMV